MPAPRCLALLRGLWLLPGCAGLQVRRLQEMPRPTGSPLGAVNEAPSTGSVSQFGKFALAPPGDVGPPPPPGMAPMMYPDAAVFPQTPQPSSLNTPMHSSYLALDHELHLPSNSVNDGFRFGSFGGGTGFAGGGFGGPGAYVYADHMKDSLGLPRYHVEDGLQRIGHRDQHGFYHDLAGPYGPLYGAPASGCTQTVDGRMFVRQHRGLPGVDLLLGNKERFASAYRSPFREENRGDHVWHGLVGHPMSSMLDNTETNQDWRPDEMPGNPLMSPAWTVDRNPLDYNIKSFGVLANFHPRRGGVPGFLHAVAGPPYASRRSDAFQGRLGGMALAKR